MLRHLAMMAAIAKVGIDGGFWISSHWAGGASYPSTWTSVKTCQITLRGPEMMKGMDLERSTRGGRSSEWILTFGWPSNAGWGVVSVCQIDEPRAVRSIAAAMQHHCSRLGSTGDY